MSTTLPELLIPAGTISKLRIALTYGADAVYVGAGGLSMRTDGACIRTADLKGAVDETHAAGKQIYVGINTLMFDSDLELLSEWLLETADLDMDAVIVSDPGALALVKRHRPDLAIHISTQASTANGEAARFWKEQGAERVVLARECTLDHARKIARDSGVGVEVFIHGAMCMAVSGRCLLSAHLCGQSGSKGRCKQSCRWEWQLVEAKRPGEAFPVYETGKETIFFGSTDLCLIEHIPELVESGVCSLKVEGRMKSEYYVAAVSRVYRAALDAYALDPKSYSVDPIWIEELDAVSHRPYATGFAFGYPTEKPQALQTHNKPISTGRIIAIVEHDSSSSHHASGSHHSSSRNRLFVKNPFSVGERIEWIGPGMGGGWLEIEAIFDEEGDEIRKTISATRVTIQCADPSLRLPLGTILRKKM